MAEELNAQELQADCECQPLRCIIRLPRWDLPASQARTARNRWKTKCKTCTELGVGQNSHLAFVQIAPSWGELS